MVQILAMLPDLLEVQPRDPRPDRTTRLLLLFELLLMDRERSSYPKSGSPFP